MSARSRKAASMASVMLLVVSSMTLAKFFKESSAVSSAFTARTASAGSEPDTAACLALVSDSTYISELSTLLHLVGSHADLASFHLIRLCKSVASFSFP